MHFCCSTAQSHVKFYTIRIHLVQYHAHLPRRACALARMCLSAHVHYNGLLLACCCFVLAAFAHRLLWREHTGPIDVKRARKPFKKREAGAAWRAQKRCFSVVFIWFSRFPCILSFGSCSWFGRPVRIVKLNDGSRDLPVSHSHTFSQVKMLILKCTSCLHTPAMRGRLF